MFYKINNKFYVKTASYYKELEFDGKDFYPSKKENTRLYEVDYKKVIAYTVEDAKKEMLEKNNKKVFKNTDEI